MSDRFKFTLPEGISQLTIHAQDELVVRGSERADLSVACDEEPSLQTTDAGALLRLADDAEVEVPAQLALLIAQVGDDLNLRSLLGQVRVEAAPDDVSIKHCGQVTLGRVQGDLSAQEVQRLEAASVDDDVSVRNVQALALGAVGAGDARFLRLAHRSAGIRRIPVGAHFLGKFGTDGRTAYQHFDLVAHAGRLEGVDAGVHAAAGRQGEPGPREQQRQPPQP